VNIALTIFVVVLAMMPAPAMAGRQRAGSRLEEVKGVVIRASSRWLSIRTSSRDREVHLSESTVVNSPINVGDKVEAQVRTESNGTVMAVAIKLDDDRSKDIEGVVRSVSATSITIRTSSREIMVNVNAATRFLVRDRAASLAAVASGVRVEVKTVRNADGTLTALAVKIESNTANIQGIVTAASPTSITLRKRDGSASTIGITSTTIVRRQGKVVNASTIAVGMRVEVEATKNADKTLTALVIDTHAADELMEIKGVVTAVGADQLTVKTRSGDSLTVKVTSDTIIRIDDNRVALTSIHVGDHVEIEVQPGSGNTLTAVRIEVDNEEHLIEIEGKIEAITGSSITVAGTRININSQTRIRKDDQPLNISALHVGDEVDVKAQRNADGSLTAVEIDVESDDDAEKDDDDGQAEVDGTVTAVSSSSVTVRGANGTAVTVTVNASTVVKKGDRPATIADVKVGMKVEIKAKRQADSSLLATRIKIDN
jgi:uncharacterized OB-fold protein